MPIEVVLTKQKGNLEVSGQMIQEVVYYLDFRGQLKKCRSLPITKHCPGDRPSILSSNWNCVDN